MHGITWLHWKFCMHSGFRNRSLYFWVLTDVLKAGRFIFKRENSWILNIWSLPLAGLIVKREITSVCSHGQDSAKALKIRQHLVFCVRAAQLSQSLEESSVRPTLRPSMPVCSFQGYMGYSYTASPSDNMQNTSSFPKWVE